MNTDSSEPQKPLSPLLRLALDLPGGRHCEKLVHYPPGEWSAATDHADVRLGENRFTGDLHRYRIQATAEEITVDVTLTGEVPPWRPSTGYMLFGADRSLEFAWLPAVPEGAVTVTYSVGGERHETTGVGYHDHNWGNVGLMKVVHDWYWARGQAGPYSVIASYITAAKEYGFEPIPIFMLTHENVLVGDDPAKVTFERDGVYTDETTGKPVAATTRYTYDAGEDRYVVSFTRRHDLSASRMIDALKGGKRIVARGPPPASPAPAAVASLSPRLGGHRGAGRDAGPGDLPLRRQPQPGHRLLVMLGCVIGPAARLRHPQLDVVVVEQRRHRRVLAAV